MADRWPPHALLGYELAVICTSPIVTSLYPIFSSIPLALSISSTVSAVERKIHRPTSDLGPSATQKLKPIVSYKPMDFLSNFPYGTISNTYTHHSPYRRETVPTILLLLDYVEDFEPGFHS
ncbi:hypothetical protein CRG98_003096 [Punica granatum]|uniref:Uncharacterized protein n=1 Tax=Punica granatum TaxID=22663 RepID=A0A2I0L760_PUNGR|nr:hypothetical protein CRG98_003096 [Punica granatum]